jgi:hypothetical protein
MNDNVSCSNTPPIEGKVLVMYVRGRPVANPLVLHQCDFEVQGGRLFLAGVNLTGPQSFKEWTEGLRRRIAWDTVEEYLIFDSSEAYLERTQVAVAGNVQHLPDGGMIEFPLDTGGHPVEPSEVYVQSDTPLEVGSTVLSYWGGRWWRAEVLGLEGDEIVRIHYPGWPSKWDTTVRRDELQVDFHSEAE